MRKSLYEKPVSIFKEDNFDIFKAKQENLELAQMIFLIFFMKLKKARCIKLLDLNFLENAYPSFGERVIKMTRY